MSVFVDTSALFALLDADDDFHTPARQIWEDILQRSEDLFCTSYVLLESFALVQGRLGMPAVRALVEGIFPLMRVHWVESEEHLAGVTAVLAANRRDLSLVDCLSFDAMRREGASEAFAFDQHFVEQGFRLVE